MVNYIDNSNIIDITTTENEVIISDTGQPGPRGKSILNGTQTPTPTFPAEAVEGDFYLKIPEYLLYGPRTYAGDWGTPVDLFTLPESVYAYEQLISSTTWTIPFSMHKLNFKPNVTVVDNNGNQVEGHVQYQNDNTVIISFAAEFSGKAYLS